MVYMLSFEDRVLREYADLCGYANVPSIHVYRLDVDGYQMRTNCDYVCEAKKIEELKSIRFHKQNFSQNYSNSSLTGHFTLNEFSGDSNERT